MTGKGSWYRTLSVPSQIFLIVFLALCLFFGVRLVGQFREYVGRKASLESAQAQLDETLDKEAELIGLLDNVEWEKERLVRQGYETLPGETVYQLSASPEVASAPLTDVQGPERPVWQQWRDLFFRPE